MFDSIVERVRKPGIREALLGISLVGQGFGDMQYALAQGPQTAMNAIEAQGPQPISAAQRQAQAVFSAATAQRIARESRYDILEAVQEGRVFAKKNPNATEDQINEHMQKKLLKFNNYSKAPDTAEAIFDIASSHQLTKATFTMGEAVGKHTKLYRAYDREMQAFDNAMQDKQRAGLHQSMRQYNTPENWSIIWEATQGDTAISRAVQTLLMSKLGYSQLDTTQDIIAKDPSASIFKQAASTLGDNPTRETIESMLQNTLNEIGKDTKEQVAIFKKILAGQEEAEEIQLDASKFDRKLQAYAAAGSLVTTFMRLSDDPDLRDATYKVDAVLNSIIATARVVNEFNINPDVSGGFILAGNFMGIVQNLAGAALGIKSGDQRILEQISILNANINDMRAEMIAYFETVDSKLSNLFVTCIDSFDRIDKSFLEVKRNQEEIKGGVSNIQAEIVAIRRSLIELENTMYNISEVQEQVQHSEDIEQFAKNAERFNEELTEQEWKSGLTKFKSYALTRSTSPIDSHTIKTFSYDSHPSEVLETLSSRNAGESLRYLSLLAKAHFALSEVDNINLEDVPNLSKYISGVESYLRVLQDNPKHLSLIQPQADLEDLARRGEDVVRLLQAFRDIDNHIEIIYSSATMYLDAISRTGVLLSRLRREFGESIGGVQLIDLESTNTPDIVIDSEKLNQVTAALSMPSTMKSSIDFDGLLDPKTLTNRIDTAINDQMPVPKVLLGRIPEKILMLDQYYRAKAMKPLQINYSYHLDFDDNQESTKMFHRRHTSHKNDGFPGASNQTRHDYLSWKQTAYSGVPRLNVHLEITDDNALSQENYKTYIHYYLKYSERVEYCVQASNGYEGDPGAIDRNNTDYAEISAREHSELLNKLRTPFSFHQPAVSTINKSGVDRPVQSLQLVQRFVLPEKYQKLILESKPSDWTDHTEMDKYNAPELRMRMTSELSTFDSVLAAFLQGMSKGEVFTSPTFSIAMQSTARDIEQSIRELEGARITFLRILSLTQPDLLLGNGSLVQLQQNDGPIPSLSKLADWAANKNENNNLNLVDEIHKGAKCLELIVQRYCNLQMLRNSTPPTSTPIEQKIQDIVSKIRFLQQQIQSLKNHEIRVEDINF